MQMVILAAGLGKRYGGLKQYEPVDDDGNFLIDYSIYDAILCGYSKVVIVIQRGHLKFFEALKARIGAKISLEFVIQEYPENETSVDVLPSGTGFALLCCEGHLEEPFLVVNADDFYGRSALISGMLNAPLSDNGECSCICYRVGNTLSPHGTVKRGICKVDSGHICRIIESEVWVDSDGIVCRPLNSDKFVRICESNPVSMNLFVLTPSIFSMLRQRLQMFIKDHEQEGREFVLSTVLDALLSMGEIRMNRVDTNSLWMGVTYRDDHDALLKHINEEKMRGTYPQHLWM